MRNLRGLGKGPNAQVKLRMVLDLRIAQPTKLDANVHAKCDGACTGGEGGEARVSRDEFDRLVRQTLRHREV